MSAEADVSMYNDGRIEALSLETGARHVVLEGGSQPVFARSGHLLFVREGRLMAVPFDAETLQAKGNPIPVIEDVAFFPTNGDAQFAVSDDGTLVYARGGEIVPSSRLQSVSRGGAAEPLTEVKSAYYDVELSPDGQQLLTVTSDATFQLWIHDIARGTRTRFSTLGYNHQRGIWTPDGRHVTYSSSRQGVPSFFQQPADSAEPEAIAPGELGRSPFSWSPDADTLLFVETQADGKGDILQFSREYGATPLIRTEFDEDRPRFSPDGHLVAYQSDESGRNEVYVRFFPGPRGLRPVSTAGGSFPEVEPRWSRALLS